MALDSKGWRAFFSKAQYIFRTSKGWLSFHALPGVSMKFSICRSQRRSYLFWRVAQTDIRHRLQPANTLGDPLPAKAFMVGGGMVGCKVFTLAGEKSCKVDRDAPKAKLSIFKRILKSLCSSHGKTNFKPVSQGGGPAVFLGGLSQNEHFVDSS